MSAALGRVLDAVRKAFDTGMLGVMAAQHDIPERALHRFADGYTHALTQDEIFRIDLAISREKNT